MKYFITLYLFLIFSGSLVAQEATTSTGGDIHSSDGSSISYTLGQIAYTTISNSDRSFAEGVQQTYNLKVSPVNPDSSDDLSIDCIVFPNPTPNNVTLTIKNADPTVFNYLLYNSTRKLIKQDNIQTNSTEISMVDLPTGVYLLTIRNSKKNIMRIFKIIKDYTR
ncbi:MAG: secreted protein with Por secretion system C-terminal sorting domain [Bacteroidetes bacterium]|nr:secreted protein with Por secretion system C-terminal sorting domain [Bacteroidota bacterium]